MQLLHIGPPKTIIQSKSQGVDRLQELLPLLLIFRAIANPLPGTVERCHQRSAVRKFVFLFQRLGSTNQILDAINLIVIDRKSKLVRQGPKSFIRRFVHEAFARLSNLVH